MSVPIMLVFDALSVLTLPEVGFSPGMLSRRRQIGRDIRLFDQIPFEWVYHDSVPDVMDKESIQDARMAEVVVPGRLPLSQHLRFVVCRTPLDRRTLLHLLGEDKPGFRDQIVIEQVPSSTFLHHGLYLTRADLTSIGLRLDFHPPKRRPALGSIKIRLTNRLEGQYPDSYDLEIPGDIPSVIIRSIPAALENCWEIELEDVLAFHAPIPSQTSVFTG